MVLNLIRKYIGGWTNHSGTVISHKMIENEMEYRGSKSVVYEVRPYNNTTVKEQRVDGGYINNLMLRCTLMGFERNYQGRVLSNQINRCTRRFYTVAAKVIKQPETQNLGTMNPWFITGFTDGEGCFRISLTKRDNLVGWRVQLFFQIALHQKDKLLLENLQNYLGVGKIYKSGKDMLQYKIQSLNEIEIILNHFDKYPLISQKRADYELFKEAYNIVLNKEHLTDKGLRKIIALRASLNLGLSEELKTAFPDIIPTVRPLVQCQKIQDANWLAGFASAEGCFMVGVRKDKNYSTGFQVNLIFLVTQHVRDEQLMNSLTEYLNCGNLHKKREVFEYQVSKFADLTDRIIPFFNKYPILGQKSKDFEDFSKVADLMETKVHLTTEGVNEIRKIKDNMNTGREWS
jgi:hypothetical protein